MRKYVSVFVLTIFLALAPTALAHESRTYEINGNEYAFTVGSLGEPVVVDDKSGVDLGIKRFGAALEGAEKILKVEVKSGDVKKVFDLETVWGEVGKYKTTFFITKEDPISYRFIGTIDGREIDFLFECSPKGHQMNAMEEDKTRTKLSENVFLISKKGSFGCPAKKSDYQFPVSTKDQLHLNNGIFFAIFLGIVGTILSIWAILRNRNNGNQMVESVSNKKIIRILIIALILGLVVYGVFCLNSRTDKKDKVEVPMDHMAHPMVEINLSSPIPKLSLDVVKDSKDGYNIHLITQNYSFTPESVGGKNKDNTGHAHLYVNGVKVARLYSSWFNLGNSFLKEGENLIEVTLNANDHSEWVQKGEHISAKTKIIK